MPRIKRYTATGVNFQLACSNRIFSGLELSNFLPRQSYVNIHGISQNKKLSSRDYMHRGGYKNSNVWKTSIFFIIYRVSKSLGTKVYLVHSMGLDKKEINKKNVRRLKFPTACVQMHLRCSIIGQTESSIDLTQLRLMWRQFNYRTSSIDQIQMLS